MRRQQPVGATCRAATVDDAEAVAAVHADSWRRNYRGAYSDAYLDGPVFEERSALWHERLAAADATARTVVAEVDGAVVGFTHVIFDRDPSLGALVENLHVTHGLKGHGIGTVLMAEAARVVATERPGSGLYLTVLEQNTAARRFYAARGGAWVETRMGGPFPGGGRAPVLVMSWPEPSVLMAGPSELTG